MKISVLVTQLLDIADRYGDVDCYVAIENNATELQFVTFTYNAEVQEEGVVLEGKDLEWNLSSADTEHGEKLELNLSFAKM